jgi:hypothetical protein
MLLLQQLHQHGDGAESAGLVVHRHRHGDRIRFRQTTFTEPSELNRIVGKDIGKEGQIASITLKQPFSQRMPETGNVATSVWRLRVN